jgi:predicted nucleic acid-binding protein
MLLALDTSVIVAGALVSHVFHPRALVWQAAIHRGDVQAMICAHALAEVYSVLSKLPGGLSPTAARILVSRVARQMRVVAPLPESYLAATERCASRGLKSGVIFDALHLIEAERTGADVFLTFNPSDFERLAAGSKPRIVVPPDPPSTQLPP